MSAAAGNMPGAIMGDHGWSRRADRFHIYQEYFRLPQTSWFDIKWACDARHDSGDRASAQVKRRRREERSHCNRGRKVLARVPMSASLLRLWSNTLMTPRRKVHMKLKTFVAFSAVAL